MKTITYTIYLILFTLGSIGVILGIYTHKTLETITLAVLFCTAILFVYRDTKEDMQKGFESID